jgi:hypothetical protein
MHTFVTDDWIAVILVFASGVAMLLALYATRKKG